MEKYPFLSCLNPKTISHPTTGARMRVDCGCCKACTQKRAQKMSFLCSVEETDNKFCHFVTLTYANEYIPRCRPVLSSDSSGYLLVNECERLAPAGESIGFVSYFDAPSNMSMLLNKINLGQSIGYCSSRDTQLFFKRLRKCLTKKYKCYESIRYYCVAEYGPIHFRPHYHILLFTNEQRTFTYIPQAIRESWKYGRIDCSLSRGKSSSYCAGYVNSTCTLPRIYSNRALKPFSHHSQLFAQKLFKAKKKEIYENEPEQFMRMCRPVCSKMVEFSPWRSLVSRFFPKCKGFACKSRGELYYSYTALRTALRIYGEQPVTDLAELIRYDIDNEHDNVLTRLFHDDTAEIIASQLYTSKHFLDFCCDDSESYFDVQKHIDYIVKFYDRVNYDRLKKQLEAEEQYVLDGFDDFSVFFDNKCDFDKLKTHPLFLSWSAGVSNKYEQSIKHKKLNDLNKIFF